jgi:hypothetical protein
VQLSTHQCSSVKSVHTCQGSPPPYSIYTHAHWLPPSSLARCSCPPLSTSSPPPQTPKPPLYLEEALELVHCACAVACTRQLRVHCNAHHTRTRQGGEVRVLQKQGRGKGGIVGSGEVRVQ